MPHIVSDWHLLPECHCSGCNRVRPRAEVYRTFSPAVQGLAKGNLYTHAHTLARTQSADTAVT